MASLKTQEQKLIFQYGLNVTTEGLEIVSYLDTEKSESFEPNYVRFSYEDIKQDMLEDVIILKPETTPAEMIKTGEYILPKGETTNFVLADVRAAKEFFENLEKEMLKNIK